VSARVLLIEIGRRSARPIQSRSTSTTELNRDPIGYFGGANLYEYVDGMPTVFIDPLGLERWGVWVWIWTGSWSVSDDTHMKSDLLTEREAYLAMYAYLEGLYNLTGVDFLGSLLGSMSLLDDGTPADPAVYYDWQIALERVRRDKVNATLHLSDEKGLDG
jgi:hypothetical protein